MSMGAGLGHTALLADRLSRSGISHLVCEAAEVLEHGPQRVLNGRPGQTLKGEGGGEEGIGGGGDRDSSSVSSSRGEP